MSSNAVAQAPSKMGFKAGTTVTVDNALKMMMVKSANDIAVVLAEGVSGSIEKFADDMNAASRRLGMTQSSWVNPNGLPADEQITSARDMAMLARAILRELPEYEMYWHIPAIRFGRRVMRNTNGLIGRYPDADGMKTGFICASGFNVVATATRNGRKLIVVVFGSRSGMVRSEKAAQLFEKGFASGGLSWLMPSLGTVDALQPIAAAPPNLRDEMCGKNRKRPAAEEADDEETVQASSDVDQSSAYAVTVQNLRGRTVTRADARPATDDHAADPGLDRRRGPRGRDDAGERPERRRRTEERRKPSRDRCRRNRREAKPGPRQAEEPSTPSAGVQPDAVGMPSAPGTFTPASAKKTPAPAPAASDAGHAGEEDRPRSRRSLKRSPTPRPRPPKPAPERRSRPKSPSNERGGRAARAAGPADPAHRAHRLPRRRQDHAAQPAAADPALAETAVIINEFGEIGLDHLLVEHVEDGVMLLATGCLCCTMRGDLVEHAGEAAARPRQRPHARSTA